MRDIHAHLWDIVVVDDRAEVGDRIRWPYKVCTSGGSMKPTNLTTNNLSDHGRAGQSEGNHVICKKVEYATLSRRSPIAVAATTIGYRNVEGRLA